MTDTQNKEPKEAYDYNTPIERTSVELAKMVLTKVELSKEFIIIESFEKADPLKKAAFIEKSTDLSIDIMKEIAKSDIPFPYATRGIDKIIVVLESLKKYIEGTITQARHETVSRLLGTRDPENNKFTEEQSTLGNLLLKLEEARVATGGNKYDYFQEPAHVEEKKEELSPETPAETVAPEKEQA